MFSVYSMGSNMESAYDCEMARVKAVMSKLGFEEVVRLNVTGINYSVYPAIVKDDILKKAYEAGKTFASID